MHQAVKKLMKIGENTNYFVPLDFFLTLMAIRNDTGLTTDDRPVEYLRATQIFMGYHIAILLADKGIEGYSNTAIEYLQEYIQALQSLPQPEVDYSRVVEAIWDVISILNYKVFADPEMRFRTLSEGTNALFTEIVSPAALTLSFNTVYISRSLKVLIHTVAQYISKFTKVLEELSENEISLDIVT